MKQKTIFLVGADTGGHVVPVFALAKELAEEKNIRVVVIGVGSNIEKRFYEKLDNLDNIDYKIIIAGKFQFKSIFKNSIAILKSTLGLFQSIFLILKYHPRVTFLKGNYATVPVAYASRLFRIPIIAHESDAVIGKSNRLISKFARKLFVSYPIENYIDKTSNLEYSGPILRFEYTAKFSEERSSRRKQTILVLGGSQGAHAINKLILGVLKELCLDYRVIHQTGITDFNNAITKKKELPEEISSNYFPISFIDDDFQIISSADLIISRASSSIFEFAVFKKPTILIPYPYASLNHQASNAKYFSDIDAAISINEKNISPKILLSAVRKILTSEKRKKELGENLGNSVKLEGRSIVKSELLKSINN